MKETDSRQLSVPCPQCGESGHALELIQEGLSIVCPSLPTNTLMWLMPDGSIIRDNRRTFKPKVEVTDDEFPEFTHDEDFFDAHDLIEI